MKNPQKGDWVSSVKKLMSDIELDMTFEDIVMTKNIHYRKIVKTKVKKYAFKYLLSKIKSKGKEIKYNSYFECQGYLKPNSILTLHDQRTIFMFRARMNNLIYNFQGKNKLQYCECESLMTNNHLYDCKMMNNIDGIVPYNGLFEGRLFETL